MLASRTYNLQPEKSLLILCARARILIHTDTHTHKGGGGEGREGERKGEEKGEGWREGRFSKNKNEFSKSLLLKALSFNHMCLRIGSSKG